MNVFRFDSPAAWLSGVCTMWRDRLRTNGRQTICLPTGLTPAGVYAEMVRSVARGHVSFADATVFALDEFGGLASDDPGRTRHTLQHQLIGSIDLPPGAFHFLDPDVANVEEHCRNYDAAIGDGFDLVLLGIGTNGHLGMNEPGSAADSPTRRVDLHEDTIRASARYFSHQQLPRWGLTVGMKGLLESKEVWVLANGSSKAAIIQRTVEGEVGPQVPASLLRLHPNCALFVDADAGARL